MEARHASYRGGRTYWHVQRNLLTLAIAVVTGFWLALITAEIFNLGNDEVEWEGFWNTLVGAFAVTISIGVVFTAIMLPGAFVVLLLTAFAGQHSTNPRFLRALTVMASPLMILPVFVVGASPDDKMHWLFYLGAALIFGLLARRPNERLAADFMTADDLDAT